jgi:hypothetical protein
MRPGAAVALAALALGGCANLGARRLPADRLDFTESLRQSDRTQILSNVVALRYGEAPSFLAVGSVVNQYVREGSFTPDPRLAPYGNDPAAELTANLLLRETPTVTYSPVTGEKLVRALLQPIAPETLMSMAQAGWAIDSLFGLTVRSINGVRNESHAPLFAQTGDPAFNELLAAARRLQLGGALSFRLIGRDKTFAAHAYLSPELSEAEHADFTALQRVLGMQGNALEGEVTIVFAPHADHPNELAIATRSMMEVLQLMSLGVDATGDGRFDPTAPVRVHSGPHRPASVYAAVERNGRWFWIAADDEASQRAILLAEILLSMSAAPDAAHEPLVTVPAG